MNELEKQDLLKTLIAYKKNGGVISNNQLHEIQIKYGFYDIEMLPVIVACIGKKIDKSGFVYFIKDETTGFTKIGSAIDIEKRLKTLQVGSSSKLNLQIRINDKDYIKLENKLHKILKGYRVHGEWFDLSDIGHKNLRRLLLTTI